MKMLLQRIKNLLAKPHVCPLLFGFSMILLRFLPMLLGKTVLFGDNFSLMVPGKLFTTQWLSQGILPLWNPLFFAGIPWIGDINQSIFYPSTVLFMLPSPGWALNIAIVSHQLFTLVGAYMLCWRFTKKEWPALIGALIWTFSPQMAGSLNNLSTLQSLSWMPWVVLAGLTVGRRQWGVVLFPLVLLMQMVAGYPQHVVYTTVTAVALNGWLSRFELKSKKNAISWLGKWTVAGIASIMLTAVLWMPFLPVVRNSTRSIQSATQGASGSLYLTDLVKIVSPYFFDNPGIGMKWGPTWNFSANIFIYLTWLGVFFLLWAIVRKKMLPTDWFLLILSTITALFAFGSSLPGFALIQVLPLFRQTRVISMILMITALLLSILISRLIARLTFSEREVRFLKRVSLIAVSCAVLLLLVLVISYEKFTELWTVFDHLLNFQLSGSAFHTVDRDRIIAISSLFSLLASLIFFATALTALHTRRMKALAFVISLDLLFFSMAYYRFGPIKTYSPNFGGVKSLLSTVDVAQSRVLIRNYNAPFTDFGFYNDSLNVRSPFSDSFIDNDELTTFKILQHLRDGATPDWNLPANLSSLNGYTTLVPKDIHHDFWDGKQDPWINTLPQIQSTHGQLSKWSTKYYLVDTWFPDYGEVFPGKLLGAAGYWMLFEIPNVLSRFRYENGEPVNLRAFKENPNQISFVTSVSSPSAIIVADRYDSDWHVAVNGGEVLLENHEGMRRFAVPAGEIAVNMWYTPVWFYRGLMISGFTLAGILGYVGYDLWRGRRQRTSRRNG